MPVPRRSQVFRFVQFLWLGLSIASLLIALISFKGVQTSEVSGNLTFFMLVLCLPLSLLAYPVMITILDSMSSQGVFPYSNRLALTAVWSLFFVFGLVQWFGIPALWSKLRPAT